MSKLAEKSSQAQHGLEVIEGALDRTQTALRSAELADVAVAAVGRRSRGIVKILLILTVVGVAVVVVKKLVDRRSEDSGHDGSSGAYGRP